MTIRLLAAYAEYPANAIVTLDAGTETGLIAAKLATSNISGGVAYVAPVRPPFVSSGSFWYGTAAQFAAIGSGIDGLVYQVTDTNGRPQYRWDGSAFVQIGSGAGGTSRTYRGDTANQAAMLALGTAVVGDWCTRTDLNGQIYELTAAGPSTLANWKAYPAGSAIARTYRGDTANQAAMLALGTAVVGDWCTRTDLNGQIYELTAAGPSTLANWKAYPAAAAIAAQAAPITATGITNAAAHANRQVSVQPAGADIVITIMPDATADAGVEWLNDGTFNFSVSGVTAAQGYKVGPIKPGETFYATRDAATGTWYSNTPQSGAGTWLGTSISDGSHVTGFFDVAGTTKTMPANSLGAAGSTLTCDATITRTGATDITQLEFVLDINLGGQQSLGTLSIPAAWPGSRLRWECWMPDTTHLSYIASLSSHNAQLASGAVTNIAFDPTVSHTLSLVLWVKGAGDTGQIRHVLYTAKVPS